MTFVNLVAPKGAVCRVRKVSAQSKPAKSSSSLSPNKFCHSYDVRWSAYTLSSSSSSSTGVVGTSSASSHRISSSVPSIELEMLHFLKDQATISAGRLRQASNTHEHTVGSDAALMFPAGMKLFWPSIMQLFHRSRRRSLKGLFRETSSG